jgi:acyl-CoA thioester hydrolase
MARPRFAVQRRFADLDPYGHVNNIAFLEYIQEARVQFLASLGRIDLQQEGHAVVRQEIDYVRPLRFSLEPIEVEFRIDTLRNASYTLEWTIFDDDGRISARGRTLMTSWDIAAGAPTRLDEQRRARMRDYIDDTLNDNDNHSSSGTQTETQGDPA